MYQVRVSAHIIRWPRNCCCCGAPARNSYRARFSRVTGRRVIRTHEKWWDVPCCGRCLDHLDAARRADAALYGGACKVAAILMSVALGLSVPLGCCAGSVGPRVAVLAAFLFLVGCCLVASLWVLDALLARRRREEYEQLRAEAERLMTPHCACLDEAVCYEGWYGSVHTFLFASRDYAAAFMDANRGKVLG
jgi:hypothetical protein